MTPPTATCPVCNKTPNPWCTEFHLPYAVEELLPDAQATAERLAREIEAYRNAIAAEVDR